MYVGLFISSNMHLTSHNMVTLQHYRSLRLLHRVECTISTHTLRSPVPSLHFSPTFSCMQKSWGVETGNEATHTYRMYSSAYSIPDLPQGLALTIEKHEFFHLGSEPPMMQCKHDFLHSFGTQTRNGEEV